MTDDNDTAGVALLCDLDGTIVRIISDRVGLSHRVAPGKSFSLVVDRGSLTKALDFLLAIKSDEAAFDWELGMPVGDSVRILHFAGARTGDELVVVGANTLEEAERLLVELESMWNEQANHLRTTLKENIQIAKEAQTRESGLYDELGRLNNELANLQRELMKKNIELEKLNQEKNRFLGMAAHDLRNPLSAIQMYSEFLLDEAADALDSEQMDFVSVIHASSQFMLQLVNDLLDVAKIESGKLELITESIDLVGLLEDNVKLNASLASRKNIDVRFHCADGPIFVRADRAKIDQVLNNLVSNGVKFSSPGTVVAVHVERSEDKAIFSVEDQGQGIPQQELAGLFQAFRKTSVMATGGEESTGLGLAIVHKIVHGHGGRVWVESKPGKGSKFFVELPLLEDQPLH